MTTAYTVKVYKDDDLCEAEFFRYITKWFPSPSGLVLVDETEDRTVILPNNGFTRVEIKPREWPTHKKLKKRKRTRSVQG